MEKAPKKRDAKEIFSAAVEYYEPHQWEGYIVDACGEDETLRQRVRELLDAHRQQDSFFDGKAAPTSDTAITERPGSRIGPYKLLQQIGEGGFGVVYMAEQLEPVRRKVALKIIKPGMDTKQVIARFEAERQALAMMDHPNVAKVLDAAATESGRPYFVMELVKGVPITEFCDENTLPTRERLELFVTVCRAVQHAHQKGVIHRDLKPSNVMVTMHDNKPMPVIIDFGVSKAISHQLTEKTLFTAYGQMVGTPAYMSPEQAQMSRMDIDTRSDIYSLGVLLYELLTGSTPLDAEQLRGTAYAEMQRLIGEEEAPRPSTRVSTLGNASATIAERRGTDPKRLGQFLRGDLDWIVMKALEKERNRRYDSANGLAMDVERFLKEEAVEACPPSLAYQLRKFYRRNRGFVTTAALIGVAVLLGIVGTTVGMIQANRDATRARTALTKAGLAEEKARKLAVDNRQKANDAVLAQQQAEALVAKQLITRAGIERQRGDISLAALLDAEALAHDSVDPRREADHRRRLAADLRQSPRPTHMLFHDSPVLDARYSTDGKWIVTGCEDGTARIWDANRGTLVRTLHHDGAVTQITFQLNNTRILTCERRQRDAADSSPSNRIHLWDRESGQSLEVTPSFSSRKWSNRGAGSSTFYFSHFAKNKLQGLSLQDGQPIGAPLANERRLVSFRRHQSEGKWAFLVTREPPPTEPESTDDNPRRRFFRSSADQQNAQFRGELWNVESGQRWTLFESTEPMRSGRSGAVSKFNQDQSLITVYVRNGVEIYETKTGERLQRIRSHSGSQTPSQAASTGLKPIEFSPDSRLLLCRHEGELVVVEVATGEESGRRIPILAESSCRFSPEGERILGVNPQGYPQIWYTDSGEAACPPMEQDRQVQTVRFGSDGRIIRVVYVDGTVRVWDGITGEPFGPLLKHSGSITRTQFSPDASHLLVAAGENVWVWPLGWPEFNQTTIPVSSTASRQPLARMPPQVAARFAARFRPRAHISPDGALVATYARTRNESTDGKFQGELRVWDSSTGKLTHGPRHTGPFKATQPIFGPNGSGVLLIDEAPGLRRAGRSSGGGQGTPPAGQQGSTDNIQLWNLSSDGYWSFASSKPGWIPIQAKFSQNGSRVWTVFAKPEATPGEVPAYRQTYPAETRLWDCKTGQPLCAEIAHYANTRDHKISFCDRHTDWSADGIHLATIVGDSDATTVRLINATSDNAPVQLLEHEGPVSYIQFCDNGRCLLTLGRGNRNVDVTLWNVDTGTRRTETLAFPTDVDPRYVTAQLSPSGRQLAVHSSFDPPRIARFGRSSLPRLPLSPSVTIHDMASGKRRTLRHERGVVGAQWSVNNQYLLTTGRDNIVRLWDPHSGELARTIRLSVPEDACFAAAQFSREDDRIVTTEGLAVRVWDVATGQPLSGTLQARRQLLNPENVPYVGMDRPVGLWSASADRFLLEREGGFGIYDLSTDQRPIDELQQMARVLSGRRVNQLGNVETLPAAQLRQGWEATRDALRDRLQAPPTGPDWHKQRYLLEDHPHSEIWHLSRLLEQRPDDAELYLRRGRLLAGLNRHEEAISDFDEALSRDASQGHIVRANSLAHLQRWQEAIDAYQATNGEQGRSFQVLSAIASLVNGDRIAYEEVCDELLADNAVVLRGLWSMQLFLLVPRSREYCDRIYEVFESNPAFGPAQIASRRAAHSHRNCVEGWLALRRGDAEEAIRLLGEEEDCTAADLLMLSIARHDRGDSEDATRLFRVAIERSRQYEDLPATEPVPNWIFDAIFELLRREAEQLVLKPSSNL